MESWRAAWRKGFAPGLPTEGLRVLLTALRLDDVQLLQGATCSPPPMMCVEDWPVEAADAICYVGWHGNGLTKVRQVSEFFAQQCREADERLQEPAGCSYFLNWFDDTPRDVMRRELGFEVEMELTRRRETA